MNPLVSLPVNEDPRDPPNKFKASPTFEEFLISVLVTERIPPASWSPCAYALADATERSHFWIITGVLGSNVVIPTAATTPEVAGRAWTLSNKIDAELSSKPKPLVPVAGASLRFWSTTVLCRYDSELLITIAAALADAAVNGDAGRLAAVLMMTLGS